MMFILDRGFAKWAMLGIAGVSLCLAPCAMATSTNALPWYESFDTLAAGFAFDGTNHLYTPALGATAVVSTAKAYDGTKSCYIPNEAVFSNLINNSSSFVWADIFAQVTLRTEAPALDTSASATFYFNSDGYAVVNDGPGSNWVVLATDIAGAPAPTVTEGQWARITVVHNYTNDTWALILKDRLLDDNIRFVNPAVAQLSGMSVSNETYLDSMLFHTSYPTQSIGSASNTVLAGDADGDGMADYWELNYFRNAYTEGAGDDYDADGRSSTSEFTQGTDPTNANSFLINLAYRDGFESGTDGAKSNTWRGMTLAGTVALQSSTAVEASKAVSLGEGSVNVPISGAQGTNVWVQIYSKPQAFEAAPSGLSQGYAGFIVLTNRALLAFDSTAWVTCNVATNIDTNQWVGFAVHLDYAVGKYDLYVSTNASFGAHMRRAHSTNFSMKGGYGSALAKIVVTNGSDDAVAYVDAFAASLGYTNTGIYALTNLVAYDRLAGQFNDASMPPYNYTGSEVYVSGQVGYDLMRELSIGDKLHAYTGSNNVYFIDGSREWQRESGASPATFAINETLGLQIQRFAGQDAVAFYPYSNMVAMTSNIFIHGTNTIGVLDGWNQLASPFSSTRYPNGLSGYNYGFSNSVAGDMIFKDNIWIFYNGSKWKRGAADATTPLNLNDAFWYFHRGTGMLWYVNGQ